MFSFLHRKKGGSLMGNVLRRLINVATQGMSDALGLTDGHMVDGSDSNGEYPTNP